MHKAKIFLAVALAFLWPLSVISNASYAQQSGQQISEKVTVHTDKQLYYGGDKIHISGVVDKDILRPNDQLVIQVFDVTQQKLVRIDPVNVNSTTGEYEYEFTIDASPVFNLSAGQFRVVVTYRGNYQAETFFDYDFMRPPSCETANNFVGDPKTYTLSVAGNDYLLRYNGGIRNITILDKDNSIKIDILRTKDANVKFNCLIIALPRIVIDAITYSSNGTAVNSNFTIIADDSPSNPIQYREVYSEEQHRLLVIPFSDETRSIQIIGTMVIPEFGSLAVAFAIVTTITLGVVTVTRRLKK